MNKRVQQMETNKMKTEIVKDDDVGISYINMDRELTWDVFGRDRVHPGMEVNKRMGKRLLEYVKAWEKLQRVRKTTEGHVKAKAEN